MDEPACPGCQALQREVDRLRAQVADLAGKLEAAVRAGKRQAAPFRKGPPKADPKTPGRKAGEAHGTHGHRPAPPPDQVVERHEATLPDDCPHCHGPLTRRPWAEEPSLPLPLAANRKVVAENTS